MPDAFAKCPLVLVEWVDSHADTSGWALTREREGAPLEFDPMRTVGWILRKNREWVEVAQNLGTGRNGDSPQTCNIMSIPRRAIISMRPLTAGDKPAR